MTTGSVRENKGRGRRAELAARLREWNRWRRGIGKYAEAGVAPPESVRDLGRLLDEVADALDGGGRPKGGGDGPA